MNTDEIMDELKQKGAVEADKYVFDIGATGLNALIAAEAFKAGWMRAIQAVLNWQ